MLQKFFKKLSPCHFPFIRVNHFIWNCISSKFFLSFFHVSSFALSCFFLSTSFLRYIIPYLPVVTILVCRPGAYCCLNLFSPAAACRFCSCTSVLIFLLLLQSTLTPPSNSFWWPWFFPVLYYIPNVHFEVLYFTFIRRCDTKWDAVIVQKRFVYGCPISPLSWCVPPPPPRHVGGGEAGTRRL